MLKKKKLIIVYTLCIIGSVAALSESVLRLESSRNKTRLLTSLFDTGTTITQQIRKNMDNGIYATDMLHIFLSISDFDLDQFHTWAKHILRVNPNASAVQLAPGGIVRYTSHQAEHVGALGHDLFNDQRRNDGALKAVEDKTLTMVGPLRLIQNQKMAVIARKPIFTQGRSGESFWGFTIVLIYIEDLLPPALGDLEKNGILYQLVGDDPDSGQPPVLASSSTQSDRWDYVLPVEVPNGTWRLALCSKGTATGTMRLLRALGILCALAAGVMFYLQQRRGLRHTLRIEYLNRDLVATTNALLEEKQKLEKAAEEIKTLKGILPMCAHCKKIRDDQGYWNFLETFLETHSDASFSHSICPECSERLYGREDWYRAMKKKKKRNP